MTELLKLLYGVPVAINKIADLTALREKISASGGSLRLIVDHLEQVRALEAYQKAQGVTPPWSVFIKCDGGQK